MGGGKKYYNPPKIERDKSFEKYLEYQMERDKNIADAAQKKKTKPRQQLMQETPQVQQVTMPLQVAYRNSFSQA